MSILSKKLIVLAAFMALLVGTSLASGDANNTSSKIAITNASFMAPSPEKENLNEEWVEITDEGSEAQSLDGWTLSDLQNHTYAFRNFTIQGGASVKVHTGCGNDTATDIYWNRNQPVWNNDGDEAILRDASGDIVARYSE